MLVDGDGLQAQPGGGSPDALSPDVGVSVRSALHLLREASGFPSAVVARVVGDDWTVVDALDDAYGLRQGYTIPWESTLCRRMAHGLGPRIAPSVDAIPVYASVPLRRYLPVSAYAGVPLRFRGELVGSMMAFDSRPHSGVPAGLETTLDALGGLVGTVLGLDRAATAARRRAERAEVEAHVDNLTQLGNRLAWSKVLVEQEARCHRYAHSACVITVDLDGLKVVNDASGHAAGDRLLQRAALVLRRTSRVSDHVARLGGDEFAVLAVETGQEEGDILLSRLQEGLREAGVEASAGLASREVHGSLEAAWRAADAAMYAEKRRRLNERVIRALVDPDSVPARHRMGAAV